MSDLDDQLRRLLHAAKARDIEPPEAPPLGLATRVLAAVRSRSTESAASIAFAEPCRQAVLWSCGLAFVVLIASLSDWQSYRELSRWSGAEMRFANSALQSHMP